LAERRVEDGARRWRGYPLGGERRSVRERKDVLCGDRDVGVVREASVMRGRRHDIGERERGRDESDRRSGAALAEAGALRAVVRLRL
jgi:hypothetical protein